jgi:periplasmic divalent cation tolerance protein
MAKSSDNSSEKAVLVLATAGGRDEAEKIGEGLVVAGLAACASVVPMIHSVYFWDGLLKREHEALLIVKTLARRSTAVQDFIKEHHSASVPEILEVEVTGGSKPYLDWLAAEVNRPR